MIDRVKEELRSRPRLKKGLLAGILAVVLFTITGFLILPPIVKWALMKNLSEALHRQVTIQTVRINPFKLSLAVRGVDIREKDGTDKFVSFEELFVNLQSLSLFKKGFVIKEARLLKPYVRIVRKEDLSYNFSDLLPKKDDKESLHYSVNNIQIRDASVDFSDRPMRMDHTLREGQLTIPFISNRPADVESFVKPEFTAKINGRPFAFNGDTKLFADSLETTVVIDIRDLDVPHYLAYSPVPMDYRFVSGNLSAKATVSYIQYQKKEPALTIRGAAGLRTVEIRDRAGNPMLNLPAVDLVLASFEPLAQKIHLSDVLIEGPEIVVDRDHAGKVNLEALVPGTKEPSKKQNGKQAEKQQEQEGTKEKSFVFTIDTFKLKTGKVTFQDSIGKGRFSSILSPIELSADHLSNAPEAKGTIDLSVRSESDETLRVQAELTMSPLQMSGTIAATDMSISKYAYYYGEAILFDMPKGRLDISTAFGLDESRAGLAGIAVSLKSLTAVRREEQEAFLTLPDLSVADGVVDFFTKEIRFGSISAGKGRLRLVRSKDGSLNISSLLPPSGAGTGKGDAPTGGKGSKTPWLSAFVRVFSKKYVEPDRPWLMELRDVTFDKSDVLFEDRVPVGGSDLILERIALRAKDLSTAQGKKGNVSLSLVFDRRGHIALKGAVTISPVSAELRLDTKKVPLVSFQPYFTDVIQIYLSDGHLSSGGHLSVGYTDTQGLRLSYRGDASLNSFASVDKVNGDDFLKWESLHVGDLDIRNEPFRVKIGEVALSDFYARAIINSDATLNFQQAFSKAGEGDKTPPKAESPKEGTAKPKTEGASLVEIDKVTLQGGSVNFTDNYIKPNFSASFVELAGRVTGLTSREKTPADVDLKGKLNNYAPLGITGKVNPFREHLYLDLAIDFKDIELSPTSPYAGKYLGYEIEKGKLSMELQYVIVDRKLNAQNKVFLDQLNLGSQVESPEAAKLPVRLAIALLKNRKGEIDLDLPLSGSLDDPQFSLGRVILKILMNILVKAATAPFALLGAIFGGGEELSYIEFDYGSSMIGEQATRKLDTVIKALHERPSLKMDVEGHAYPEKDAEGLRQHLFDRKLKTQKFKELVKKGDAPRSVDEVIMGKEEYPTYLKMAYKEEKFPKPRNVLGFAKDLPVAEMEKLILTNIVVKEDDLRTLAHERAQAVKDYILRSNQVQQERIFLVEPKSLIPEKKENVKESRVDFRLK